jgi:hypothetical protein
VQSDLLDVEARLRAHRDQVLNDLRRMGYDEWQLRTTVEHHGPHGLHQLWVSATEATVAKHEVITILMRAPGSSRA